MKKLVLTLVALLVMAVQASAMSYEQARQQALFLTDKMAYELNLTDAQYEAAYEINLDYLMSINAYDDLYGIYWRQRNLDLSYVLLDWQYHTYVDAAYFYHPLYWDGGYWHFSIYARYPHRDYFFFGRPNIYVTYYGGHSWRMNGGRSWYYGRHFDGPCHGDGGRYMGMRDGFDRGDFGRGKRFDGRRGFDDHNDGNRSFGNGTRFGGNNGNRSFGGGNRTYSVSSVPSGHDPQRDRTRSFGARESSTRTTVTQPSRSFGGNTTMGEPSRTFSAPSRSFGTRSSESGSSFGSAPNRSFGSNAPSRSFGSGSSSSARSFGGNNSSPARSFGGGNSAPTRSFGGGGAFGGSHNSGGGHFGNGR